MLSDLVRDDFDRLARLVPDGPGPYDDFVLAQTPPRCARALEVGCGTGSFARRLARRCDRVLAVDLSPEMIAVAREHARGLDNLELRVADALEQFPDGEFDLVVSIAALHHLPFAPMLEKFRRAIAPGGTLLVHDLLDNSSLAGRVAAAAWALWSLPARARANPAARAAWKAHEAHDRFLRFDEVRSQARAILPGARVRRHLRGRYTLIWRA